MIIDLFANTAAHDFSCMTLDEAGLDTLAMLNHQMEIIDETASETSLWEAELLGVAPLNESRSFKDKVKDLGEKILTMLKKVAAYIMGMVASFIKGITQMIDKDAYTEKDVPRLKRGAEYLCRKSKSGKYEFTGLFLDDKSAWTKITEKVKKIGEDDKMKTLKDTRDSLDNLTPEAIAGEKRADMVGESGNVDAKDYSKKLMKYLTGYEEMAEYSFSEDELKKSVEAAVKIVKDGKDTKKNAKDLFDKAKKAINDMSKEVVSQTRKAKDIEDDSEREDELKALKKLGEACKGLSGVVSTTSSTCLKVLSMDFRSNLRLLVSCHHAGESDDAYKKRTEREAKKAERDKKKAEQNNQNQAPAPARADSAAISG